MTIASSTSQSVLTDRGGIKHVVVRPDQRVWGFEEESWLDWERLSGRFNVVPVVQSDTDDLSDAGDGGTKPTHALNERESVEVDAAQVGRKQCRRDVDGERTQVPPRAILPTDQGLLTIAWAVPGQSHADAVTTL